MLTYETELNSYSSGIWEESNNNTNTDHGTWGDLWDFRERNKKKILLTSGMGNIHTNQISCSHYPENLSEVETKINRLIYCWRKYVCATHISKGEHRSKTIIPCNVISIIKKKPGSLHYNKKMFFQGHHSGPVSWKRRSTCITMHNSTGTSHQPHTWYHSNVLSTTATTKQQMEQLLCCYENIVNGLTYKTVQMAILSKEL